MHLICAHEAGGGGQTEKILRGNKLRPFGL